MPVSLQQPTPESRLIHETSKFIIDRESRNLSPKIEGIENPDGRVYGLEDKYHDPPPPPKR